MQRRKSFFNNEMEQRFSLRKYTIGLCSVCLGFVTIGMGSQTVKADTVNNIEKSSVVQENKMQDAAPANTAVSTEVKANTPDSANITPTETKENETGSVATTAPKTNTASNGVKANTADSATSTETKPTKANSTVANSNIVSAQAKSTKAESVVQPKVSATSTEAKLNETDSVVVKPNAASKEAKPNIADSATLAKIKLQTIKLAKPADAKALAESKVATDNQFNFGDWTTQINDTYLNITGYKGDRSKQIIVPNGADFAKAGKNDKNLQVAIGQDTLADLIVDGVAPKLSNTDGQKIVANGSDWSDAFSGKNLYDISGLANLDTSNVTNMGSMFDSNRISDLSPLSNWNTGKVTNMGYMFDSNQISDLSSLANWNTGNVTNMGSMFDSNRISDLSPLSNWNTGNVTYMGGMFDSNRISDLSSLANWNTGNVTDMGYMFHSNRISDLSPLSNWNTGNVTDMGSMFDSNRISDLSPLSNWNTGNVTNMGNMFDSNRISDLSPLSNWNTGKVTGMGYMFHSNRISDLSPLSNWNTGNVTYMGGMFDSNRISDLSPLSNWNTGKVTYMHDMFSSNQISDLSPLSNWNTGNVTDMDNMFSSNQISDLSPLADWNTGKVTDMHDMFSSNQISDLSPLANWNTGNVTDMREMFKSNQISDLSPLANWNTGNVTNMESMFDSNRISDLSPLANWNTGKVTNMDEMFKENPLNVTINSQSTLNKFHASAYKLDNIGALASHSESQTFKDGSQILLDKNVVTESDSATLTFKANSATGNTYQIKIYNPNDSIDIQAAALPTALGTTDTSYQDGYTIITNKFINNGSVSQAISIAPKPKYPDRPDFAQYESTSGLITVANDKGDLGSINITYQNVSDFNSQISAPYIGNKPYINHTQNTFYFQPQINSDGPDNRYSFIKSAGLTITVPDDVTIDPDTFIDATNGKTLKATKIADNQYQVVLNDTTDGIAVKGLINVSADKLANGNAYLPGFGMKYTINTYNDKVMPLVATGTSKELSVIPDLASYHGGSININQSKWAFDRNGNEVYDYTSQDFTNNFNGIPLEPAVSTQVTNGVETFDMPTGVNITYFDPKFNKNVIDHIDYIYTDGSKQTASSLDTTPKAIRQMKVYFKNGIQSDELADWDSDFNLSFDATYPDGTPIKNFDTFKITGSFSCDELGSTGNVDVAQVMLAPTQKLTDRMLTNTSQNESNTAPNANGNFIGAAICNDGLQHQGHLTNPIFYFKYNDLMVPDLSEISASYNNQNKQLGSIGFTDIDKDKIHSSIIADSTGKKFIKVQVDGEYYYGGSFDRKSGFNVQIPINNMPDALTAAKDWSWYILNNNDEAKTESIIQNSSQGNEPRPVTVDGNTLSVGGTGTWQIITAQGFTSSTETQGNLNGGPGLASTQDDHQQDPTHFTIYDSIINATNDAKSDLVSVANLPSTQDGKSQFDVHMIGKASLINAMTGQTYDATITYSYGTGDNNFITGDQVTDWSKVKSIKVVPNGGAPSMTSLRLVVPVEDKTVYDDVGKTIYMSTMTYGEDKTNTNYTIKDGFAVPEKSTILPIIIKAGDMASAKLTVQGQATVHTLIHYKDANGKDVYVKLADQDKTYNELQDTMKRSDYLQSDSDLTIADRELLPTGMVIDYNHPTIRNSNNTYAAGYANNVAAFDKTVKYDFDGDQVIFEGAMPEIVTKTHQAKETIHYVYRDGRTAAPDKVLTSITLKQTGYKNPFTGEITWNTSATDTLNSVDSPEITGYIADKLTVPSYVVTMDSPNKEVTVTYDANNGTQTIIYQDEEGSTVGKQVIPGKTDETVKVTPEVPDGYVVTGDVPSEVTIKPDDTPITVTVEHGKTHIDHEHPVNPGDHIPGTKDKTYPGGLTHDDLNKTVTRDVTITDPTGKKSTTTQTVTFTRGATVDEVTNKVTYDDWSENGKHTFDKVDVPTVHGYTASGEVPEVVVTPETQSSKVDITYTANNGTQTIIYQDEEGSTVGKQVIPGKTDETVKVTPEVPDGYVVTGDVPSEVTIKPDDTPITVTVEHGKTHIDHEHPVNPGDHIPGTKDKTYPGGLTHDDLNKTVTRDVTITDPTGKKSTTTQTVTFTRGATVDEVTNKVTYDDWSENGKHTFDKVDVPTVHGYTASGEVPEVVVTPETQSSKVDITYTANNGTQTIIYQDEEGSTVGKQVIPGKTDETVKVTPEVPDGYVVTGDVPSEVTIKPDDTPITVTVEHGKTHIDHEHPVNPGDHIPGTKDKTYPGGLTHDDLNKTVTRDVTITDPTGKKSTTTQTVTFTRGATVDEVTNKVTYDDWSENGKHTFDKVDVPTVHGYTASGEVPEVVVTPETQSSKVDITYTANAQTAKITYIDDTEKKTLGSDTQNGKFNQAIIFEHNPAEVIKGLEEKGYKLVSDNFKPGIKYQNDNKLNIFEVHLVHTYEPVETSQTITETVHYIDANGKPVAPDYVAKVVIEVTGTRDKVTDSIIWNTPSTGHFDEVISPEVPNMTPDKKLILGRDVQYGDSDITENVVYTPDKMPREPGKPNDQGKPDSKASEKPAKLGKKQENGKKHVNAKKSTSKRNAPVHGETVNGKSKAKKNTNSNVRPHAEVKPTTRNAAPKAQVMPAGQHVNAKGQILNTKGQVVGHVDKNAQAVLPQTGEKTTPLAWLGLGLASLAAIFGLAGDRKRR